MTTPNSWLITGASSGIGAALARSVARQGALLFLTARRADQLDSVANDVRSAGAEAVVLPCDLTNAHDTEAMMRDVLARTTPDVVVHNAGRGNCNSIEDTSDATWDDIFALNVDAVFRITRAALPAMRQRNSGHFVTISSVAGRMAFPFNAAYVAAKHAVTGFTAALRTELAGTNIFASIMCPAGVTTNWANATDGGPIGTIFADGIRLSRTIAKERGLPLAPLTPMMSAEAFAHAIVATVERGRSSDVFTHAGTMDHAALAVTDRNALDDAFLPLHLGMQQAYRDNHRS